ncbi:MAG TPA: HD domain-containing protein, partial [Acidimicrobiales bacterium]|nr:HD domain-containing protein [Acidimicrobiales bacterium]
MTILDTRAQLAADDSLAGRELCKAWTGEVDRWLGELFTVAVEGGDPGGVALVAVGGYGRSELSLQSDIDVLLLHAGRSDIGELADRLWYPIWDARLKLGHAVRTVKEALALAADDLDTATGLLQARHLAGDRRLSAELVTKAELQWRKRAKRWLAALGARVRERHRRAGEVAFLLEPDLKEGRGGMRDVHALAWAQAARTILWGDDHASLGDAYDTLLAARVELHRRTGRPGDRLLLQEQDAVAAALGYPDADMLMRAVAHAARTIAWTSDDAWARIDSSLTGPLGRARRERALGGGLVLRDGEVHLRDDAAVGQDPALALRAAAAAARHGTQLDRATLARLAAESPAPPVPWTPGTRAALVDQLLAGPPALLLLEALDQQGIWERYFPEWPQVRSKPQRNAYHRYTVDRHLWEAAVGAGALAGRVRRPDLLVLAGLLHDIGKGQGGDHTDNGVALLAEISPRMGLDPHDAAVLAALCRHHLLLADVATRRDIDDPATIEAVAGALGDRDVLELLAALTEA